MQTPFRTRVDSLQIIVILLTMVAGVFYPDRPIIAQPVPIQQPQQPYPLLPIQPLPVGPQSFPQAVPLPVQLSVSQTPEKLSRMTCHFPLCIAVSESFVNHFVQQETRETGPVRDFVLGAQVVGNQQTQATTRLDFVPYDPASRLLVVLSGTTNNQTTNYTPQAVLKSEGSYLFQLTKQVEFDGYVLKTWSPTALLTINQRNREALTPVTGVPFIGPLANLIAISEAEHRRPLAEQIAAQKVTQQVGPRFNNEIDAALTMLNEQLENVVRKRLEEFRMMPKQIQTTSTNDAILFGISLNDTDSIGLTPPPVMTTLPGVQIFLHESHINDFIARLPLANLELPDTALERIINYRMGQERNPEPAVPNLATIVFDGEQPAKAMIRNGAIEFEIRMAFRPVLGPMIPTQRIIYKTQIRLSDSQLIIHSDIEPLEPLDPNADKLLSEIAEKAIRQLMGNYLQEQAVPRSFDLPMPGKPNTGKLVIENLVLENGWLILSLGTEDPADCPVPLTDGWQPR